MESATGNVGRVVDDAKEIESVQAVFDMGSATVSVQMVADMGNENESGASVPRGVYDGKIENENADELREEPHVSGSNDVNVTHGETEIQAVGRVRDQEQRYWC